MEIIEGFKAARLVLSRRASERKFADNDREQTVRRIIDDVRERGDAALLDYTKKFDGAVLTSLEVDINEIAGACDKLDEKLAGAIRLAEGRIRAFHEAQKKAVWHEVSEKGLRQLIRPLRRVGIYVPGGTASYPSTVLMTAVPARVAGVREVIMVTPPDKQGRISPAVMAAAEIAEVDRIFCIGGAQAIAALAYGTESVPAVDKICGPGNIFVTTAKKQLFGIVDIDGIQGPSEVMIIADEKASPEYCAADLLAQAEHDPMAEAYLVTTSRSVADGVNREVERQLKDISRRSIAGESLARGVIAIVSSLDEAVELCNLYAPEHLCLMMEDAASLITRITNAGCILAGREATVTLGDYVAGPSHVLPTGGTARFGSPLNVCDFIKFINVIDTNMLDIKKLGEAASVLARAEGLDAHAAAIERRLKRLS